MKITEFLQKNIAWNLNKECFLELCCASTTEEQLLDQLNQLADKYFPQRKKVEIANTEFCLNEIALKKATTPEEKCVKQLFNGYWQTYLRVKSVFDKGNMLFPSDGKQTRLEKIAQLIACCTQFAVTTTTMQHICDKVRDIFDLEERENRNLENAVNLFAVNHFCAVAKGVFSHSENCIGRLARLNVLHPLKINFEQNIHLRHAYFSTKKLVANLDCLANSATKFTVPTFVDVKPYFYINGKNVFDTFCYSKFGKKTAEFFSENGTVKINMQYFLHNSIEIRKFTLQNTGKGAKKLVADFLFRHTNPSGSVTYFDTNGALCFATEGDDGYYCALAVVFDNKILPCPFEEGRLSAQLELSQNAPLCFDLVTVFAENMPTLANELQMLNCFGNTRCPHICDSPSECVVNFNHPLNPTSHGHTKRSQPQKTASTLNFTYQLGDGTIATFLDNFGNSTTLMDGFVFGVGGEKVFAVKNGAMAQINCEKFSVDGNRLTYLKQNGTQCTVSHENQKCYSVQFPTPSKTLFFFPLEEKSKVSLRNNTFSVLSERHNFSVECVGQVESFTTNALECNNERLRYKLSNNLSCGTCLAVCFATSTAVQLKICSSKKYPPATPLVRESLVSTYLNYINNKNVFCLCNNLKRAESLTLAAIAFTNPLFVKQFVSNPPQHNFYYDAGGRPKQFLDKLAIPLATVYWATISGEKPDDALVQHINGILFCETFSGRDLCIKALALKKAAHLKSFDKVRCLIEYSNLKRIITTDTKLFGYAQAIGAVPLSHPSKERLKDLCNRYDIPKCWYYVSQLENLYGLTLADGAINFAPKVSQENVLEQLALTVAGKRIDTSFCKSTVQSLTLNGTQYFLPLKIDSLKNQTNTLVVHY